LQLEHAQASHVSREIKALIEFVEARVTVERAVLGERLVNSLKSMRAFADEVMRGALSEWATSPP
jgi:hypothetical protein